IVGEILNDDDGDGIIDYKFNYNGATVYALIVLDPSRVYVGTALPEPNPWGGYGITLDVMVEQHGAVAGINAGGFRDDAGAGNGWPPRGTTYSRGVNFSTQEFGPIAALDNSNNMWVGHFTFDDCDVMGVRDAVCFGPVLVSDGVKTDPSSFETGIGARTAVGQREDGAIVLVVVDGRQGYSIGITFEDLSNIMADKFECINATNMDGGNSSCMYYKEQAVNRSSNQAGGTRYLPDAWLVDPLPENYVRPETVPEFIVLPENPLGEVKEYVSECDQETKDRMFEFVKVFVEAYYGYFGTSNANYYYPTLKQYVAPESELLKRMDYAVLDRTWVNTGRTDCLNLVMNGAYLNEDGTYDIVITSDIFEYATYWSYEALGTTLRITVVESPDSPYGYLATATY
ncbi:MAG: phosphodiester glycosidase family protein, partial [Oscillospiraceae bacterium]|nr:phosphodiester glycosidase family protein [Oscillospiraceae bacterium]